MLINDYYSDVSAQRIEELHSELKKKYGLNMSAKDLMDCFNIGQDKAEKLLRERKLKSYKIGGSWRVSSLNVAREQARLEQL